MESQLKDSTVQLSRLLDLDMNGGFSKDMLLERKTRLEESMVELEHTRSDLLTHLRSVAIDDEQVAEFEAFCAEVRAGLDHATAEKHSRSLA